MKRSAMAVGMQLGIIAAAVASCACSCEESHRGRISVSRSGSRTASISIAGRPGVSKHGRAMVSAMRDRSRPYSERDESLRQWSQCARYAGRRRLVRLHGSGKSCRLRVHHDAYGVPCRRRSRERSVREVVYRCITRLEAAEDSSADEDIFDEAPAPSPRPEESSSS